MSKRQLGSRYKDLVDYIENEDESLTDFLTEAIEEGYAFHNRNNKLWRILEDLYTTPLVDFEFGDLTKTIVDIFEDNYELEEPECYWVFKELKEFGRHNLYFGITFDDEPLLVDISDGGTAERCTKSELNNYLRDTELTADNFTPVEEIDND
ncbi:hypothetical protein [Companilactobacillus kimchii]|uniref:Uncharacterized protein n=2 Tax=Companilactobacillus kimchii TaxID=2801452 RepID=A0ABR5NQR6_9LACO|nr:hypothetical protein [Companilactobacillus kimchii]KAE9562951.1 hypothetical protein ATN91_01960 [Companilactobacillus kimchii]KRK49988.1 hypothetical protein FC97_GL002375 [Companilactobacillus kimchii DSM 13961 = JCM 10707]OWF31944.1 hypothetical protein LKACC12383_02558 [Companilactobacillus kimchii]GEO48390.1 hypothetical protein LKI01_23890 [Companilactobacillus paralimentarius]